MNMISIKNQKTWFFIVAYIEKAKAQFCISQYWRSGNRSLHYKWNYEVDMPPINNTPALYEISKKKEMLKTIQQEQQQQELVLSGQPYKLFIESCRTAKTRETSFLSVIDC